MRTETTQATENAGADGNTPVRLQRLVRRFRAPCLLPKRIRTLWGDNDRHWVRPALISEKFGNGKRLLCVAPINRRPAYYLVWIDDRWDLNDDGNSMCLREHMDEIYDVIEEEFGRHEPRGNGWNYRWPEADFEGGSAWWPADAEDISPNAGDQRRRE